MGRARPSRRSTPQSLATPIDRSSSSRGSGSTAPPDYTLPPHPYTTGKRFQANRCPVCELYTTTEVDRPANTDPDTECLRARFRCHLCGRPFDMGMVLFDARGVPGVTLDEGEDRFVPPVPPAARYPCPRCWMTGDVQFERMVVYVREDSSVACVPACPAHRLNFNAETS